MDYAVHTMPSYQHLQDTARPAHHGSKNSEPHLAGGDAGYTTGGGAKEHNPGGATNVASKKGSVKDSDSKYDRGHPPGVYQ